MNQIFVETLYHDGRPYEIKLDAKGLALFKKYPWKIRFGGMVYHHNKAFHKKLLGVNKNAKIKFKDHDKYNLTCDNLILKEKKKVTKIVRTIKEVKPKKIYRVNPEYQRNYRLKKLLAMSNDQLIEYKLKLTKQRVLKDRSFTISISDIQNQWLIQKGLCFYTGIVLAYQFNLPNTFSIDRLDSTKGYDKDNIVLCIFDVNRMKSNHSLDKFLRLCNQISKLHPL